MYTIDSNKATLHSARVRAAVLVRVKAASLRRFECCLVVLAFWRTRENRVLCKKSYALAPLHLQIFNWGSMTDRVHRIEFTLIEGMGEIQLNLARGIGYLGRPFTTGKVCEIQSIRQIV